MKEKAKLQKVHSTIDGDDDNEEEEQFQIRVCNTLYNITKRNKIIKPFF
jgi:hypothetical protein